MIETGSCRQLLLARRSSPLPDARNFRKFLVRAREGVGDYIGLAFHVTDVGREFRHAAELIRLTERLRVRLLMDGRNQTLVVGI